MRVVLDTNVFVSAVFFGGPPHRILDAWHRGRITLVVSVEIIEEYRRVGEFLREEFGGIDLEPILQHLVAKAELVDAPPLETPVCRDPDDDRFLACARAAGVGIIASGDKDLLALDGHGGIRVLKPRHFVDLHLSP